MNWVQPTSRARFVEFTTLMDPRRMPGQQRIEMHLVAQRALTVLWPGGQRHFDQGEQIHTENSYKYTLEGMTALLHQAGVTLPLELTMKLPPTPYARQGGEVIAAMLAQVGITAKIENVEWAQWLSGVYGQKAYDLTVISHVEPLDFGNFARPNYYWGYESAEFNQLWAQIQATIKPEERSKLMGQAQAQQLGEGRLDGGDVRCLQAGRQALCVCGGAHWVMPGEQGLVSLAAAQVSMAWRCAPARRPAVRSVCATPRLGLAGCMRMG